jgi:hypothetical protein
MSELTEKEAEWIAQQAAKHAGPIELIRANESAAFELAKLQTRGMLVASENLSLIAAELASPRVSRAEHKREAIERADYALVCIEHGIQALRVVLGIAEDCIDAQQTLSNTHH